MVNKQKKIIQEVPESIVSQARLILESKTYSSKYRRDIVRLMVGACAVCRGIPTKLIVDKQDDVTVISRYCDKDFEKYQKYNKNKKNKRAKK